MEAITRKKATVTTIARTQVSVISMPLTEQRKTATKTIDAITHLIVRLEDASGLVGWGEAAVNPTFTDESAAEATRHLRHLLDAEVRGQRLDAVFRRWPTIASRAGIAARSAVSVSLWDLRSRALALPLHALLGPLQRDEVDVAAQLGFLDHDRDAEEAERAALDGFRLFKLKVGRRDVREDIAAATAVRAAIGPEAALYVDANQAWSREDAEVFIRAAAEITVGLVEQPVASADRAGLAALGRTGEASGVIVAADEGSHDLRSFLAATDAGERPSGVVVKLLKSADLAVARDLLRVAPEVGTTCFLAGMPGDTSIASAALLHLATTAPDLGRGTAIAPHLSRESVTGELLPVIDGRVRLADLRGPGLGIVVEDERVAALTTS